MQTIFQWDTNADLKISVNVWVRTKLIPEYYTFLIQRILELFTRKVCLFLKNQATL